MKPSERIDEIYKEREYWAHKAVLSDEYYKGLHQLIIDCIEMYHSILDYLDETSDKTKKQNRSKKENKKVIKDFVKKFESENPEQKIGTCPECLKESVNLFRFTAPIEDNPYDEGTRWFEWWCGDCLDKHGVKYSKTGE